MAEPFIYTPTYSYSGYQASNPTRPLPAPKVDNDFAKISQSTSEIALALRDIRRSDGKLQNGLVTIQSLESSLSALIAAVPGLAAAAAVSATAAAASAGSAAVSAAAAEGSANVATAAAQRALENATGLVIATQAQAEAGVLNDKGMTPLRTFEAIAEQAIQRQKIAKVITVGAGGDFTTINDALKAASRLRPDYVSKGLNVEVRLLSGFIMVEQVFIVQEDLSFVTVTSVDTEVVIQRSAINQNNGNSSNNWRTGTFPAWCAMRGGKLPFLKTLFSFDNSGTGTGTVGVYLFEGAVGVIARGCGVKNAGWRGLYIDGAWAYARETIWTGAGFSTGPDGVACGIRGSNQAVCMVRQAVVTGCSNGAYFSDCIANVSDGDFSNATGIGLSSNAGANVYGGGVKADNCGTTGFHITNGGKMTIGESSNTAGVYPSAQNCGTNAILLDSGGEAYFARPTFSSLTGAAISLTAARLRLDAGSAAALGNTSAARGASLAQGARLEAMGATLTSAGDYAVRMFNGSEALLFNSRLDGPSGEIQFNGGSRGYVGSALRTDNVSPIRMNIVAGDFSPLGEAIGADGRTTTRGDADFTLSSSASSLQIVNTALTATRNATLYDSTNWPDKRHTIVHAAASGSALRVYQPGGTVTIAVLAPGEAVSVVPNGSGGWAAEGGFDRDTRRSQASSDLTLTPGSGDYIRSSVSITVNRTLTMYSAADGSARAHTFSRTDAGAGNWIINEPGGATIATLAANQWAIIVPLADGSAWYVAARGSLI